MCVKNYIIGGTLIVCIITIIIALTVSIVCLRSNLTFLLSGTTNCYLSRILKCNIMYNLFAMFAIINYN